VTEASIAWALSALLADAGNRRALVMRSGPEVGVARLLCPPLTHSIAVLSAVGAQKVSAELRKMMLRCMPAPAALSEQGRKVRSPIVQTAVDVSPVRAAARAGSRGDVAERAAQLRADDAGPGGEGRAERGGRAATCPHRDVFARTALGSGPAAGADSRPNTALAVAAE
jgi:hypothetical protein